MRDTDIHCGLLRSPPFLQGSGIISLHQQTLPAPLPYHESNESFALYSVTLRAASEDGLYDNCFMWFLSQFAASLEILFRSFCAMQFLAFIMLWLFAPQRAHRPTCNKAIGCVSWGLLTRRALLSLGIFRTTGASRWRYCTSSAMPDV